MLLDSQQSQNLNKEPASGNLPRYKVRIRFCKAGDLRLVSHHDLMHVFERMLRRAGIPVRMTDGFHPKPKLVFALSLALGIVGTREVLEMELLEAIEPDLLRQRLEAHSPPGLAFLDIRSIDPRTKAQPLRVVYRLKILPEKHMDLLERIESLLTSREFMFQRLRPQPRLFNLRAYIRRLWLEDHFLHMDLWVSPHGMVRPEEILGALGISDVLDQGAILERNQLELVDEVTEIESLPESLTIPPGASSRARNNPTSAPPTSLLPGPLSFDS